MTAPALRTLYEDRELIVLEKPAGVCSEETPESAALPGVPNLLRAAWGRPDAYIGVVSRLDTAVSGVMVYAKTKPAAAALSRQSENGTLQKRYRCLCIGIPSPAEGSMEDFLFKDSRSGKVYPVKTQRKGAKPARLSYRVLQSAEFSTPEAKNVQNPPQKQMISLCEVQLFTGRTHQIRVQFASRKHPLLGDGKYGSRVKMPLALQCCALEFEHPKTHQPLAFALESPWAEFFSK